MCSISKSEYSSTSNRHQPDQLKNQEIPWKKEEPEKNLKEWGKVWTAVFWTWLSYTTVLSSGVHLQSTSKDQNSQEANMEEAMQHTDLPLEDELLAGVDS